jgi:hypothetical protein
MKKTPLLVQLVEHNFAYEQRTTLRMNNVHIIALVALCSSNIRTCLYLIKHLRTYNPSQIIKLSLYDHMIVL